MILARLPKNDEKDRITLNKLHLGLRVAILVISVCVIMTAMALMISSKLYYIRVREDTISVEYNITHAVAKMLDIEELSKYISQVREIYENAPPELRDVPAQPDAPYKFSIEDGAYERLFDPVITPEYKKLQKNLESAMKRLQEISVDVSFYDKERKRKVYVIYGLGNESFSDGYCAPGYWNELFDDVSKYMDSGDVSGFKYTYTQHGWKEMFLQCIVPIHNEETGEVIGFVSLDTIWDAVIENRNEYLQEFLTVMVIATVVLLFLSEFVLRLFIITPLRVVTAEQERINTELDVASGIQKTMLPNDFSIEALHEEGYDIFASMVPAKEVGGDFYNFFMVDEEHLVLMIADVSGKGVPAALFMMISKIIIDGYVKEERLMPGEILQKANNAICDYNNEGMFVTVWLGIVNIKTGKAISASGGHEFPVICNSNGEFQVLRDKHGFVLGGFPDMPYEPTEFEIEKGGAIFIYTDGVPETTSATDELFGEERMLKALNSAPKNASPREIINHMKAQVDGFVGKAMQFDDMTMLCLTRK